MSSSGFFTASEIEELLAQEAKLDEAYKLSEEFHAQFVIGESDDASEEAYELEQLNRIYNTERI